MIGTSYHTKTLREDAHSAQWQMVAEATAPRRENPASRILFHFVKGVFGAEVGHIQTK